MLLEMLFSISVVENFPENSTSQLLLMLVYL